MEEELLIKDTKDIVQLGKVLGSYTRVKILKLVLDEGLAISELAQEIGQTQANTSAQIKMLEKVGLMDNQYLAGEHGVKKICKTKIKRLIIEFE